MHVLGFGPYLLAAFLVLLGPSFVDVHTLWVLLPSSGLDVISLHKKKTFSELPG